MSRLILPPGVARPLAQSEEDKFTHEVFVLSNILGGTISRFDPDPRVVRAALWRVLCCDIIEEDTDAALPLRISVAKQTLDSEMRTAQKLLDAAKAAGMNADDTILPPTE
jgi:hypothetical protein